ncbi:MAG: Proliferation-associated protein 2G4 [Marteilia pararefringens]
MVEASKVPEKPIEPSSLRIDANLDKSKKAASILHSCLGDLIGKLRSGKKCIYDLCKETDAAVVEQLSGHYMKLNKGVAFPTCISQGKLVANFNPLSAEKSHDIEEGKAIKIELGVHVDSFPVFITHTLWLGSTATIPKPLIALHYIRHMANALFRQGKTSADLIHHCNAIASSFGCQILSNVECYNISKNLDLHQLKLWSLNPTSETRKASMNVAFEVGDYYSFEVILTETTTDPSASSDPSGNASSKGSAPILVPDNNYDEAVFRLNSFYHDMKLKQEKLVYGELKKQYGKNYFTTRDLFSDSRSKFGWQALKKQIEILPVYKSSDGNEAFSMRQCILVRAKAPLFLSGLQPDLIKDEHIDINKIPEESREALLAGWIPKS